jgi:hypothetical protein
MMKAIMMVVFVTTSHGLKKSTKGDRKKKKNINFGLKPIKLNTFMKLRV